MNALCQVTGGPGPGASLTAPTFRGPVDLGGDRGRLAGGRTVARPSRCMVLASFGPLVIPALHENPLEVG
jgi:hypothetical protein